MMLKDKHGKWSKTPREEDFESKLLKAKENKDKANTPDELKARIKELESLLGI